MCVYAYMYMHVYIQMHVYVEPEEARVYILVKKKKHGVCHWLAKRDVYRPAKRKKNILCIVGAYL